MADDFGTESPDQAPEHEPNEAQEHASVETSSLSGEEKNTTAAKSQRTSAASRTHKFFSQINTPAASAEGFIVSYTSLSIILLALFIFLNTLANPDSSRERRVIGSLAEHFIRGAVQSSNSTPEYERNVDMPIPELNNGFPQLGFATRYSPIADAAESEELVVERKADRFLITIPGQSLFDSGDNQIKVRFLPVLEKIARKAVEYDLFIAIEGHTDNRPISTNRFPSNWSLSIARAVSVLRYFLELGVPTEHVAAMGRGEFNPIADNETEEGRASNRRIQLIITERKKT